MVSFAWGRQVQRAASLKWGPERPQVFISGDTLLNPKLRKFHGRELEFVNLGWSLKSRDYGTDWAGESRFGFFSNILKIPPP